MKVLIVHDYATLNGGAEYMSRMLRDQLRERGHEARFFASRAKPLPLPLVADDTCFGTTGPLRRVTQVVNPSAVVALRRTLRAFRPDVVHVRMFMTQLSPAILPLLQNVPAVLHLVNYNLVCPLNTKRLPGGSPCHRRPGWACHQEGCLPLLGVARAFAQGALWSRWGEVFDCVVANSHCLRRRVAEQGVHVDDVIHNGVPVSDPRPPLQDPPTVAYAGRLVPKKGVDVLLRAMARVREDIPHARLLIAGDGPDLARLQRLATELGITRAVTWLGHLPREELAAALGAAWVQITPSVWEEPFGLVAAETSMRGTAALVSDAGGVAEVVEEGVTGHRFPSGDANALAAQLRRVLSDRDLAERLGAAGREHALANFTEDRVVDRFLDIYRQIQPQRSSAPRFVPAGAQG